MYPALGGAVFQRDDVSQAAVRQKGAFHSLAEYQPPEPAADGQLNDRQYRRLRKVELKPQCLVNSYFKGGGCRAAAEGHDDGKTGKTQGKHQSPQTRYNRLQGWPFNRSPQPPTAKPPLRRHSKPWRRHGFKRLEHHASRQRCIEKYVGQQYAVQPIQVPAMSRRPVVQQSSGPALTPVDANDARNSHNGWQYQTQLH